MGDAGDDDGSDEPIEPAPKRADVIAEWDNVRSARRLYTALNEAREDTAPVAAALVRRLLELDPRGARLQRSGAVRQDLSVYERFMRAAGELGEVEACDVVRSIHPRPPLEFQDRLPGYLFNRSKSPTDRAPRTFPNAVSHVPTRKPD